MSEIGSGASQAPEQQPPESVQDAEARFFERYNRTLRNRVLAAFTPLIDRAPKGERREEKRRQVAFGLDQIILEGRDESSRRFEIDAEGVKALQDAGLLDPHGMSTGEMDNPGWEGVEEKDGVKFRVGSYWVRLPRANLGRYAIVDVALALDAVRVQPDLGQWRTDFTRWELKRYYLQARDQARVLKK